MNQTGEGKLQFNNVPEGTKDEKLFHNMHSPLLSGGRFVKKGKYTLVYGQNNGHVVKRRTGKLVKEKMKQAKEENSNDIVMTVPFDEKY